MHKIQSDWKCDKCEAEKSLSGMSRPANWQALFLVDDDGNRKRHWDFCSPVCRDEWVTEKGL